MAKPVGPLTRKYFKRCGYNDERIDSWNSESTLLQDVGLIGDGADDEFTTMRLEFGVDLSGFEIDRYFPRELSLNALIISCFGWTPMGCRIKASYPAITLEMVETALLERKWIF